MLFYCTDKSARLAYILNLIGTEILGEPFELTNDKNYFRSFSGPRINYSVENSEPGAFFLQPHRLLFETGILEQEITCFDTGGRRAFFKTKGDFSFDIFAASFYLVSRYEEWLPFRGDKYDRFPHELSLAFKENFLDTPLINYWLVDFKKELKQKFPDLTFRVHDFKFIPSYDIDIAYSYKSKGFKRNLGGFVRDLLKGRWEYLIDRWDVLFRNKKDPFDAYEWLDSLHLYCRTRAYYFFLVAKRQIGIDKNISPDTETMRSLISYHAGGYTVGIHPSWQSSTEEAYLREEADILRKITGKSVEYSRQHYLRMSMPDTYRKLINLGVKKDFSMGYGSINGFRASIASSFYWYDLLAEKQTDLMIFPFCFMDANAFYHQKLNPGSAFNELMNFYLKIKRVNGLMITIWHNQIFGSDPEFKGWKEVYEIFLKDQIFWDM
jgi:hypothetical protein